MHDRTVITARPPRALGWPCFTVCRRNTLIAVLAVLSGCSTPVAEPDEDGVRAILTGILSDTPGVDTQLDEFTLYGCQESHPDVRRCDVSYTYTVTLQAGGGSQTNSDGGVITVQFDEGTWQLAD